MNKLPLYCYHISLHNKCCESQLINHYTINHYIINVHLFKRDFGRVVSNVNIQTCSFGRGDSGAAHQILDIERGASDVYFGCVVSARRVFRTCSF